MMGWLFYDRIPAYPEAEIRRICTAQDGTRTMMPVVIARDGMTWYAAVRVTFASAEYPTAASSPRVSNAARRMNGRCAQVVTFAKLRVMVAVLDVPGPLPSVELDPCCVAAFHILAVPAPPKQHVFAAGCVR